MAHLKEVVERIKVVTSTKQITQAMKMISASKLYKVQQLLSHFQENTTTSQTMLHAALHGAHAIAHPLLAKGLAEEAPILLVVITSDRGLCGAFNKNVLKAASSYLAALQPNNPVALLVIGKKSYQFFKKSTWPVIDAYMHLSSSIDFDAIEGLATYCIDSFKQSSYGQIIVIYNSLKHANKQEIVVESLLPFVPNDISYTLDVATVSHNYIYEPNLGLLLDQLMIRVIKNKMITISLESSVCEHAARVMTMGKASDNAEDLLKELRTSYNRSRQALITNSIAEITGGAEALLY